MAIKGFIFDFDGLILDTEAPLYRAWNEIYAEYSLEMPLKTYAACIGSDFVAFDPAKFLMEISHQDLPAESLHLKAKARGLELLQEEDLREGFPSFLEDAKAAGVKLAVASSSTREWVFGNLIKRDLFSYFDLICTADDVSRVKPAPDLYLTALGGLEIEANEAVAFEDSLNGVVSACAAGIQVVAVPNELTQFMDFSQAALVIPSLAGIFALELIQRLPTN